MTGHGNTLNGNHPIVRRMIIDCLRYWVAKMHVDGFRFDLASILVGENGNRMQSAAPVGYRVRPGPGRDTKLIAEAWDAAGFYQVGTSSARW